MRNPAFRGSRYALASLSVVGALVLVAACEEKVTRASRLHRHRPRS
jgi:hypothetical protein